MTRIVFAAVLALALVDLAGAQTRASLKFKPQACVKAGELPLMQLQVEGKGELRSYFRRLNTTDWCSVEGVNDGPLSRVVMPKFEAGDEIEFFFVLLDGRRVVARSPQIYRVRVSDDCDVAFARHVTRLALSCGEDQQSLPSAMMAAYAVNDEEVVGEPELQSPDRPLPPRQ
jgi:hypothetical protein